MSGQGRVAPPASAPANSFPPILTEIPQISNSSPHFSPRGLSPSPPPSASCPCDPPLGSTPPPKNRRTKPTFSPLRDQDSPKNSSDYSFPSPLRKDDSLGEVRSSSPSQLDLQCPRSPSPPRTSTTPPPDQPFTAASPTKSTAPSPTTTPGFAISRGNSSPRSTETSPGFADGKGGIPPVKKRRASARRSSPPPLTFARSSSPTSPRRMRGEAKASWIGTKPRKEATGPVRSPSFSPPLSPHNHFHQRAYSPVSTSSSSHSPPVSSSPCPNTSPNPPLLPPPSSTSFELSSPDGIPMKSKDSDDLAKSQSIVIGDPIQKSHTTTSILSTFSAKDRTKSNEFDESDLTSTASSPASTTAPSKKMVRQPKKKRLSTLHGTPMSSSMGSASFPQPSLACSSRGASTNKKTKRTASPSLHSSAEHCRSEDRVVRNWGDLVYYHNSKIKVIFEELLATRVPNFMQPVMCEGDYKTFSVDDADNNEKQLYDARTTLLTFQENLHEHFERLFGLLSFLPLPWDENTLSEVFHYKWMVVSFSTTADLDHLGALASAYQESCKSLYKAERERSKRRGILSKGLLGRFGKGRDKDKKGDESLTNVVQCDLKAIEKSLSTSVLTFFRTMGNLIKFAEKFRMDPNGVLVGSEPCDTLLAELSHLPLLSEMTHEQQQFNRKNAPSPPPTALNNKKKGRGNKEQNSGPLLAPTPPEPKKKNPLLDEEVTIEIPEDVPITCLNTNMGAFPDRVQMIQRFVLWGRMLEEDFERNDVAEEMEKLEKILAAELWLEQVWQEGGGLLIPGEILIGIIPETEIQRVIESTKKYSLPDGVGEETWGEGDDIPYGDSPALTRMQQVGKQVGKSSYPLMFCRYVGTRRHGLLVEIGGICGEPIFLTWQQAVPLPDSWKKLVRNGEPKDVEELVAEEKQKGRYSRKEKGLKRVVTNNKLALEPTVLSLSAYASRE